METSKIGPPKTSRPKLSSKEAASLSSGRLTPYLAAATSIIDSVVAPPDLLESAAWKGQPLLLVMSDDSKTWMSIRDNSQSKAFHVIGTEFENRRDDELINGFVRVFFI